MIDYKDWERKAVKVTSLFLDPDNIRLDLKNKSQDALITDLFSNEDAMQILEAIVRYGFFPDELPLIIKNDNKMIVLEGNRRVAALKAIITPSLIPSYEARIKALASNVTPIEEIEVVIAPNRTKALQLLANKHTKNTRRKWRLLRQSYFYHALLESGKSMDDLRNEYPGVDIVKFIKMWEFHTVARSIKYDSDEISAKAHNQKTFPVSTIERLYDDVNFRKKLNFSFDQDGKLKINSKQNEFNKNLKRVISDAVDKNSPSYIDTRILGDAKNRQIYIKNLEDLSGVKGNKALGTKDFTPLPTPSKTARRTKLAPRDVVCTLKYPALHRMLGELQRINYRDYPNAAHDLLRSFLECSLKGYFDYKKIKITPSRGKYIYLSDLLNEAGVHFQTEKLSLVQSVKIIKGQDKYLYSEDYLNAINHNPTIFSVAENVEDAWDQMEPLLRFILDPK